MDSTQPVKTDDPSCQGRGCALLRRFRSLGPAAPLLLATSVLPPLGAATLVTLATTTGFALWLRAQGGYGAAGTSAVFWVLGLCLLPTNVYTMLTGWCFGFAVALPTVLIGYVGAASFAYYITRALARAHVAGMLDRSPRLGAVSRALLQSSPLKAVLVIALLRLSPAAPFAISNVALASAGVTLPTYLAGTVIGMLPRTIAAIYLAAGLSRLSFDEPGGMWMFVASALAIVFCIAVLTWLARRELNRVTATA